jgi:hypothetical protein
MSSRSRPTQAKRAREKALMEKRQMKAAKRADTKDRKPNAPRADGIDPDIADIVPGPQQKKNSSPNFRPRRHVLRRFSVFPAVADLYTIGRPWTQTFRKP